MVIKKNSLRQVIKHGGVSESSVGRVACSGGGEPEQQGDSKETERTSGESQGSKACHRPNKANIDQT